MYKAQVQFLEKMKGNINYIHQSSPSSMSSHRSYTSSSDYMSDRKAALFSVQSVRTYSNSSIQLSRQGSFRPPGQIDSNESSIEKPDVKTREEEVMTLFKQGVAAEKVQRATLKKKPFLRQATSIYEPNLVFGRRNTLGGQGLKSPTSNDSHTNILKDTFASTQKKLSRHHTIRFNQKNRTKSTPMAHPKKAAKNVNMKKKQNSQVKNKSTGHKRQNTKRAHCNPKFTGKVHKDQDYQWLKMKSKIEPTTQKYGKFTRVKQPGEEEFDHLMSSESEMSENALLEEYLLKGIWDPAQKGKLSQKQKFKQQEQKRVAKKQGGVQPMKPLLVTKKQIHYNDNLYDQQEFNNPFAVMLYPKDRLTGKFKKSVDLLFVKNIKTVEQQEQEAVLSGLRALQDRNCKEKIAKYKEDLDKLKINQTADRLSHQQLDARVHAHILKEHEKAHSNKVARQLTKEEMIRASWQSPEDRAKEEEINNFKYLTSYIEEYQAKLGINPTKQNSTPVDRYLGIMRNLDSEIGEQAGRIQLDFKTYQEAKQKLKADEAPFSSGENTAGRVNSSSPKKVGQSSSTTGHLSDYVVVKTLLKGKKIKKQTQELMAGVRLIDERTEFLEKCLAREESEKKQLQEQKTKEKLLIQSSQRSAKSPKLRKKPLTSQPNSGFIHSAAVKTLDNDSVEIGEVSPRLEEENVQTSVAFKSQDEATSGLKHGSVKNNSITALQTILKTNEYVESGQRSKRQRPQTAGRTRQVKKVTQKPVSQSQAGIDLQKHKQMNQKSLEQLRSYEDFNPVIQSTQQPTPNKSVPVKETNNCTVNTSKDKNFPLDIRLAANRSRAQKLPESSTAPNNALNVEQYTSMDGESDIGNNLRSERANVSIKRLKLPNDSSLGNLDAHADHIGIMEFSPNIKPIIKIDMNKSSSKNLNFYGDQDEKSAGLGSSSQETRTNTRFNYMSASNHFRRSKNSVGSSSFRQAPSSRRSGSVKGNHRKQVKNTLQKIRDIADSELPYPQVSTNTSVLGSADNRKSSHKPIILQKGRRLYSTAQANASTASSHFSKSDSKHYPKVVVENVKDRRHRRKQAQIMTQADQSNSSFKLNFKTSKPNSTYQPHSAMKDNFVGSLSVHSQQSNLLDIRSLDNTQKEISQCYDSMSNQIKQAEDNLKVCILTTKRFDNFKWSKKVRAQSLAAAQ